jgi:hypothetical protein
MTEPSLSGMLKAQERRLQSALEESRETFRHRGLSGDGVEAAFRELLNSCLPRYLTVGTGEVIDRTKTRTGQVDVLISNLDQPFRQDLHEPGLHLIEGVSAGGEVKSRLTTRQLDLAIDGGRRFKKLRNGHLKADQIFTNESDLSRFYDCPPYFLVAFENDVAMGTIVERLSAADRVVAQNGSGNPLAPIDAVFILNAATVIDYGDGAGALKFIPSEGPDAGKFATGYVWSPSDSVLIQLLLWLNASMPRVHRFAGIATEYLAESLRESSAE